MYQDTSFEYSNINFHYIFIDTIPKQFSIEGLVDVVMYGPKSLIPKELSVYDLSQLKGPQIVLEPLWNTSISRCDWVLFSTMSFRPTEPSPGRRNHCFGRGQIYVNINQSFNFFH